MFETGRRHSKMERFPVCFSVQQAEDQAGRKGIPCSDTVHDPDAVLRAFDEFLPIEQTG